MAFIKILEEELSGPYKATDNQEAIILSALDYVMKNLKAFTEIVNKTGSQK